MSSNLIKFLFFTNQVLLYHIDIACLINPANHLKITTPGVGNFNCYPYLPRALVDSLEGNLFWYDTIGGPRSPDGHTIINRGRDNHEQVAVVIPPTTDKTFVISFVGWKE